MKIKKDFTLRTMMGQNVILAEGMNADSFGKLITLNDTAAYLWEQLYGKEFNASDAADLLVKKYGIDPQQALADATYILDKMTAKGLME